MRHWMRVVAGGHWHVSANATVTVVQYCTVNGKPRASLPCQTYFLQRQTPDDIQYYLGFDKHSKSSNL